MKKALSLFLVFPFCILVLAGCAGSGTPISSDASRTSSGPVAASESKDSVVVQKKIAFITPQRLGDEGPVDLVFDGIKKAADDFNLDLKVVEAQAGEYEESMRAMINEGCELIVGAFPQLADAFAVVSKEYPDVNFLHALSSTYSDNMASTGVMYQESAFAMGVLAGSMTKTNKLAFIYGVDNKDGHAYHEGFVEGVNYVNPEAAKNIPYSVIGNFEDAITAKEIALTSYNNGVDIIFSGGGKAAFGIMEAVKEMGEGYYYFGCAWDYTTQTYLPGRIPACHMANHPQIMYDMISKWNDGNFVGECVVMRLKNSYMECKMADEADCHIDQEYRDIVKEVSEKIQSGELVIKSMPSEEEYIQKLS